MEYIDIHYCHQKVCGVWMGPILWQRLGNPSYSVQELAVRWLSLKVVMPGTVPINVTEGSTSDVATAYLATLDPEAFSIAAESITYPPVDNRERRRGCMLDNRVFTFNEFVCEVMSTPAIVNPEMYARYDGEVEERDWSRMQMLRQWFSCRAML